MEFLYKVHMTGGTIVPATRTCKWLASRAIFQQNKICKSDYELPFGLEFPIDIELPSGFNVTYDSAWNTCTTTCCRCPCSVEPSAAPSRL